MRTITKIVVLGTFVAGIGLPGPAHADGPGVGNVTGGDVSGPGIEASAQERRESLAKLRAVATAMQGQERTTWLIPKSKSLPLRHRGQSTYYYCGPASGLMMLLMLRAGRSKITHAVKSQQHLADADHMRTDANRATTWSSRLFRIGINKWRQGKAKGFYREFDAPNVRQFKKMLVADVVLGYPIAADTVEIKGGPHYNGHPSDKTIGHWIVGYGYRGRGAGARFGDPATTLWSDARPSFTARSRSFVPRYLQRNGIVW